MQNSNAADDRCLRGFYPRDRKTGAPLSALEFHERLLTSPASIQWERIAPPLFGFKDDATALRFFHRGANEWHLIWAISRSAMTNSRSLPSPAASVGCLNKSRPSSPVCSRHQSDAA